MEITRSRPMMKNDNARAEEKNRHRVRDVVGYGRFDHPGYIKLLNRVYRANNLLTNHFYACSRVIFKTRQGGKLKRQSDQARTPYARVMETLKPSRKKEKLETLHKSLNPLNLRDQLENALRTLFDLQARLEKEEEGLLAPPFPPRQRATLHPGVLIWFKKALPRSFPRASLGDRYFDASTLR